MLAGGFGNRREAGPVLTANGRAQRLGRVRRSAIEPPTVEASAGDWQTRGKHGFAKRALVLGGLLIGTASVALVASAASARNFIGVDLGPPSVGIGPSTPDYVYVPAPAPTTVTPPTSCYSPPVVYQAPAPTYQEPTTTTTTTYYGYPSTTTYYSYRPGY